MCFLCRTPRRCSPTQEKASKAPEGMAISSTDWLQIELRMLARLGPGAMAQSDRLLEELEVEIANFGRSPEDEG